MLCIIERLSRERILHCGSLGERGCIGRTLRRRGRGKLAWLRKGRRPGREPWWSFLFSGILRLRRRFDLLRLSRLLRRDRRAGCHRPRGVWRNRGARCNQLSATGRSSNENTVAAPAGAPMIAAHHDQARRANEATHRCYIAPFWIEVAGVTQHEVLPRQSGRCPSPVTPAAAAHENAATSVAVPPPAAKPYAGYPAGERPARRWARRCTPSHVPAARSRRDHIEEGSVAHLPGGGDQPKEKPRR